MGGQLTYDSSKYDDPTLEQDALNYPNSMRFKPSHATTPAKVSLQHSHDRCIKKEDSVDPVLDDVVAKLKNYSLVNKHQVNRSYVKEEKIPSSRVYSDVNDIVAKLKKQALILNQPSDSSS